MNAQDDELTAIPAPTEDWIHQRDVGQLLGISDRTASLWAQAGKFVVYEHGVPSCGRRKYSRELVQRFIRERWGEAMKRQRGTEA